MPRKTLLQLLQEKVPCKKPDQVRHPVSGRCGKPSVRAQQPDMWKFVDGHWMKLQKMAKAAPAHPCPPGQRYSGRSKKCVEFARHEGPRAPRSDCKYGFDQLKGRCKPKPAARELDPRYEAKMTMDVYGRPRRVFVLKSEYKKPKAPKEAQPPKRASDPRYMLNPESGRYVLRPEFRKSKPPAHPCPKGERYSIKQSKCMPVRGGCPKGQKRSKSTEECYTPIARFLRQIKL